MDQTPLVEAKFKGQDEATLRLWAAAEARSAHCAWHRSTEGTSRRCGQRRIDCPPKIGNVLQIAPSACQRQAALQCEPQKRCARARADDKPASKIGRAIGKRTGEAVAGASQRIGPRRVSRATSPMHSNRWSGPLQSIDDWSERRVPDAASQMAAGATRSSSTCNASTPHCTD